MIKVRVGLVENEDVTLANFSFGESHRSGSSGIALQQKSLALVHAYSSELCNEWSASWGKCESNK